ncbi:metallophosphoesterase [Petrocella sp. FN5]|uniref:metallophosphoesterase n=1 Tax=Petrocella sp. FN5 TaxID=3032002 RepID=UPI0023DB1517|nr:metallophosphoesterase [Petrocella sp. FN5]MDF1617700.1 metallophosphoesterase [Petrocella sp. FN5]
MKGRKNFKRWIGIILTICLFILVFWNQPIYRYYKIDGKQEIFDLKVILISDLHSSTYGTGQRRLMNMITEEAPDMIWITGDLMDEYRSIQGAVEFLEGIKDECPIYYVSGNHEYWHDDPELVFETIKAYGVMILENESVTLNIRDNEITITGVIDPDATLAYSGKEALIRSLSQVEDMDSQTGYRVLLSHRPEHIEVYESYGFDLVVSGHTHGGQVRIPFLINGLYAPNQGFMPKYAGGYYAYTKDTDLIVSRGLSFNPRLPRVFNPPEVVVIEWYD